MGLVRTNNSYTKEHRELLRDFLMQENMSDAKAAEAFSKQTGIELKPSHVSDLWNRGRIQSVCTEEQLAQIKVNRRRNDKRKTKASGRNLGYGRMYPKKASEPPDRGPQAPIHIAPTLPADITTSSIDYREGACPYAFAEAGTGQTLICNEVSLLERYGGKMYNVPEELKKFGATVLRHCPTHAPNILALSERRNALKKVIGELRIGSTTPAKAAS